MLDFLTCYEKEVFSIYQAEDMKILFRIDWMCCSKNYERILRLWNEIYE